MVKMRVYIEHEGVFLIFATSDEFDFVNRYGRDGSWVTEYSNTVDAFLDKYPTFRYCGYVTSSRDGSEWVRRYNVTEFSSESLQPSMWDG